jgi:hypothetical protein
MTTETQQTAEPAAPAASLDLDAVLGKIVVEAREKQQAPQPRQPAPQAPVARQPAADPAAPRPALKLDSNIIDFQEPSPEILGLGRPVVPPSDDVVDPAASVPGPAAPQDPPEPPEVRTNPRAAKAWEFTKKELKEARAQAEAARQQALELKRLVEETKSQKSVREAELERRNEVLETEIGRHSLRATKAFQEEYVRPVQQEYGRAISALMRAGQSQDEAKTLVTRLAKSRDPEELESAISELPRVIQGVVSTSIFNAQELEKRGYEAEAAWKQTKAALDSKVSQIEETTFKKNLVKDTTEAAAELADKFGSWAFRADPGNAKWMEQREKMVLTAQHVLQNGSERDWARAVLDGVAAPMYRAMCEAWREKAQVLQDELDARDASRPRIGIGGSIERPAAAPAERPKTMSLEEGIAAAYAMNNLQMPE